MSTEYRSVFFLIALKRYQIKNHYLVSEEKSSLIACFFSKLTMMVKFSKNFWDLFYTLMKISITKLMPCAILNTVDPIRHIFHQCYNVPWWFKIDLVQYASVNEMRIKPNIFNLVYLSFRSNYRQVLVSKWHSFCLDTIYYCKIFCKLL